MDDSDHASGSSDHEKGLGDVGIYRTDPDVKEQERKAVLIRPDNGTCHLRTLAGKESVVSDGQSSSESSLQDDDEATPPNRQFHDAANPKMISFEKDDRDNPYNWSQVRVSPVTRSSILIFFSRPRSHSSCSYPSPLSSTAPWEAQSHLAQRLSSRVTFA